MVAIKARFDGEKIVLPESLRGLPPQEVILVYESEAGADVQAWMKVQEPSFAKAWENNEDAAYDKL